jgi:ABC-2 type transport system ATP-binding protein
MSALMELSHLEKKIGNLHLNDINLKLESGYIIGLIGVNGSGKTTLINTILNLYKKDSGLVKINGISMETHEKEAKDQIGFVLDENMFEDNMSVISNGKIYGSLYSKFDEKVFCKFCDRFEIPLKKKLGKLSAGLKVRFQLAFALSHDAKLFIMDEPAAGLNPVFRKELINCMQEIVEDGTRSVLFSTHITEDLDQIGDYIVLLHNGKIFFYLSKEELQEKYLILKGTKEQIQKLEGSKIIYREYGEYHNCAFIEKIKGEDYLDMKVKIPIIEEVMYYLEKGGYSKC